MSTYRKRTGDASPREDDYPSMSCGWCHAPTKVTALSMFGGRCGPCYGRYCAEVHPGPNVGDKRHEGPKAWAYALKDREENGAALSSVQRMMWRAALRHDEVAA